MRKNIILGIYRENDIERQSEGPARMQNEGKREKVCSMAQYAYLKLTSEV